MSERTRAPEDQTQNTCSSSVCVCVCVRRVLSLSRAYQSLELQRRRDQEQFSHLDGKKKEQAERLGMGFGGRRSALIHTTPKNKKKRRLPCIFFPLSSLFPDI